jgi:hypothetical protein
VENEPRNRQQATELVRQMVRQLMDDREVLQRIGQLTAEEQRLYQRGEAEHGMNEDEVARLHGLEVLLDQCWDLLRQRRAKREFGLDPDDAKLRDATTVERYEA